MRRRTAKIIAGVALTLLAACGSDGGGVSQPEDELLDQVEQACRTAARDADKLDLSGDGSDAVNEYVEIIALAHDEIEDLEPPTKMKKDFDNFVGDLDDQVTQGKKLVSAIDGGDQTEITTEIDALAALTTETDNSAKALGALQCRRIAPDVTLIGLDTGSTIPDQTVPVDTTPVDTTPVDSTPVDTTPVDTTPVDTTPVDTTPTQFSTDLSAVAAAPAGHTWTNDVIQVDVDDLFAKSVLGPLVLSYEAGEATDESGGVVGIYVITISEPWSEGSIRDWLVWERLDKGTESVTPAGFPITVMPEAFPDSDCIGYYADGGTRGIALCTFAGEDGKPILDAFIAANPG